MPSAGGSVPPELTADICEEGIYLTGGGALLDRLDTRLSQETGAKFKFVSFKCGYEATTAVLGGQVPFTPENLSEIKSMVESKKAPNRVSNKRSGVGHAV